MTTEADTQGILNIAGEIPEDWVAELNSGHIIVVPSGQRHGFWRHAPFAVFAPDAEQLVPVGESPAAVWENLVKALAETQYGYHEFRSYPARVRLGVGAIQAAEAITAYGDRLAELRDAAEEEGVEWSENSERDFQAFVTGNPSWRKAALGLMDNGNLRAVWKGDDGSHLGLQFLGGQFGEYVIFKRRSETMPVSRVSGVDTLDGVIAQVGAFNLDEMVIE